jgi:hypothetical protein
MTWYMDDNGDMQFKDDMDVNGDLEFDENNEEYQSDPWEVHEEKDEVLATIEKMVMCFRSTGPYYTESEAREILRRNTNVINGVVEKHSVTDAQPIDLNGLSAIGYIIDHPIDYYAEVLKIFLECGANPNQQYKIGHVTTLPLNEAVYRSQHRPDVVHKFVRCLVEFGANVNACPSSGRWIYVGKPLYEAIGTGHIAHVQFLLENGALIEKDMIDAFDRAINSSDSDESKFMKIIEMIEKDLDANYVIDSTSESGETVRRVPVNEACSSCAPKRLRWLLEHGAKTDVIDSKGNDALMSAISTYDIVRLGYRSSEFDQHNMGLLERHTSCLHELKTFGVKLTDMAIEHILKVTREATNTVLISHWKDVMRILRE